MGDQLPDLLYPGTQPAASLRIVLQQADLKWLDIPEVDIALRKRDDDIVLAEQLVDSKSDLRQRLTPVHRSFHGDPKQRVENQGAVS